jgi:gliding motility-associated-like protein
MRLLYIFIIACTSFASLRAQEVWLHPNNGQWDDEIAYQTELKNGHLLVDQFGFTYALNDAQTHRHKHEKDHLEDEKIKFQVIKSHFIGSSWSGKVAEGKQSSFYRNYYLGQDSLKWRSGIRSVAQTSLVDFYPGVNLLLDGSNGQLKYSLEVAPGVDVNQLRYRIEGSDSIWISEGQLHIHTRFGEITESQPIAWTIKDGRKVNVPVQFELKENVVQFRFPDGFDASAVLIIDPSLVFSTFTGATADNWGMTATPDQAGNLYAGGIVFAGGGTYPTVTGSFDVSFNGGANYIYTQGTLSYSMNGFDTAISKFSADGTSLLFSTYLGGSDNEAPHSLVVDNFDNLYVMGVTGSSDFPVVAGCFDVTHNGGPIVAENELGYNGGADLYISRFNAAGTALVGSTFVGGSGTDGINIGNLNYNYGDSFRGEIIVANGFVYVSSTTRSTNFPTLGASQGSLNGLQDAVIFRMNANLTAMSWSTYFGGSGLETGNSLQVASNGNVFVAGGTTSSTLPFTSGNDLSYNGGTADGYVVKLQGNTSFLMSGTFMGLSEYDQAYFVQLDIMNDVYVYGQSESAWPISPGVYGNPNSGQFIRKYTNNMLTIPWTTMIGAGTGYPEISPTAFLVSDCGDIYISGWGGTINSSNSTQALFSTTSGFPVTSDGYQLTTNGSNFYIAVLSQNAATLKYATFMGGMSSSYNHVDGGTSRFDKSGRIYHAVCGACGGQDFGFTSTPGVWSPTNNSFNCNLAAFKFELSTIDAIVTIPQNIICLPNPVVFSNNSANGNSFLWNFGDNTTSTLVNPTHVYPGPGVYTVTLVVSDSSGCYTPDSVAFDVTIGDFQGGVVNPIAPVCPGESIQLEAFGGITYAWSPGNVLDDSTSATPIASISTTTQFTVVISDSCGTDTLQLTLDVYGISYSLSNDTSVCIGGSVPLLASGGGTYTWSPPIFLSNALIADPICLPDSTTEYLVTIVTPDGCEVTDSVTVSVYYNPPLPILADTIPLCFGSSVQVQAAGASTYNWYPTNFITPSTGALVTIATPTDTWYYCDFINACGSVTDSVWIDVIQPEINAGNDTIVCPGESAFLWASGGVSYSWSPFSTLNAGIGSSVIATPQLPTVYVVTGTDVFGCQDTADVFVDLYPPAFIQTTPDVYAIFGDEIQLGAISTTPGTFIWYPADYLSCVTCQNPIASPPTNAIYTVQYTDANGCSASDQVTISFDPIIYVPNTFTPDGDEFNNGFQVIANNITSFELSIFNRWGERIYVMNNSYDYWDGSYNGLPCPDGTYTWKLTYVDFKDQSYSIAGHINLLR